MLPENSIFTEYGCQTFSHGRYVVGNIEAATWDSTPFQPMSGFFSQVLLTQPVESLLKRGKKDGWSGLRQVPKNSSNSAEGLEVSNSDGGL